MSSTMQQWGIGPVAVSSRTRKRRAEVVRHTATIEVCIVAALTSATQELHVLSVDRVCRANVTAAKRLVSAAVFVIGSVAVSALAEKLEVVAPHDHRQGAHVRRALRRPVATHRQVSVGA